MTAWRVTWKRGRALATVPKLIMASKARRLKARNYRVVERSRETSAKRGYGYKWASARKGFLQRNPLCLHCQRDGRTVPATEVDHIIPHRGNQDLFWDVDNWQALCKSHHSRKTANGQ